MLDWFNRYEGRSVKADIKEMAIAAARAAEDKKANDILVLDMHGVTPITDYFIICSGANDKQVARIQKAVEDRLRELGDKASRREGERYRRWILLDYIDLVVHIFLQEEREFYELERLWKDAPLVDWEEPEKKPSDGTRTSA
jgi:ribosome-associated protein